MANRVSCFVDVTKCVGCRACQVACKQWNLNAAEKTVFKGGYGNPPALSPSTFTQIKFKEMKSNGSLAWIFRKHGCYHCENAACVNVCPTEPKALSKHEMGFTVRDSKLCIGCGACVEACPFKVPQLDVENMKAKSCTFCIDRVTQGKQPACVKTCPPNALTFGKREDILKLAYERQKQVPGSKVYGDKNLGDVKSLNVIYLLPVGPKSLDLPESPKVSMDVKSFWEKYLKQANLFKVNKTAATVIMKLLESA